MTDLVEKKIYFINDSEVKYEDQTDLKVFKVEYSIQAGENNGKWFFTQYANQAIKRYILLNIRTNRM